MKITSPTLKKIKIGAPTPLQVTDLERLNEGGRTGASIQRLRASHHKIARLIAKGLNAKQVGAYTGYTSERVCQLVNAPAMKELIATYMEREAEREDEAIDPFLSLASQNMLAAQRHIADHIAELDNAGELLPVKTALAIAADGADRTGYGKKQTVTVNHDFAAMLEKAIRRSGKTIEGQAERVAPRGAPTLSAVALPAPRPVIARRA